LTILGQAHVELSGFEVSVTRQCLWSC